MKNIKNWIVYVFMYVVFSMYELDCIVLRVKGGLGKYVLKWGNVV